MRRFPPILSVRRAALLILGLGGSVTPAMPKPEIWMTPIMQMVKMHLPVLLLEPCKSSGLPVGSRLIQSGAAGEQLVTR